MLVPLPKHLAPCLSKKSLPVVLRTSLPAAAAIVPPAPTATLTPALTLTPLTTKSYLPSMGSFADFLRAARRASYTCPFSHEEELVLKANVLQADKTAEQICFSYWAIYRDEPELFTRDFQKMFGCYNIASSSLTLLLFCRWILVSMQQ